MFFRILNLSPSFLVKRVEEREDDESYLEAMVTADNFVVVNDAAECGVKLCHDFLGVHRTNNDFSMCSGL